MMYHRHVPPSGEDAKTVALMQSLARLRDQIARRMQREGYKILSRKTIQELATRKPASLKELRDIHGIGEKKIAQFGEALLAVIRGQVLDDGEITSANAEQQENVFTVSAFLDHINTLLAESGGAATVQGEISGLSRHPSGIYFSLKDANDESILQCYLSPWSEKLIGIPLEDGMEVKASGTTSVYKPRGRFSFRVEHMELAGEGSLKKAYEILKRQLESEGLFERKRPLPQCVRTIGIITSRTGAVIHDFQNNLDPLGFHLHFMSVRVEGAHAVEEITHAIEWMNMHTPTLDVLVVIRGGGSLEELQAFNNERVARALFSSRIPTICGIGHDRDVPIASLVADEAPSTPTAAAVLVNTTWQRLRDALPQLEERLLRAGEERIEHDRTRMKNAGTTLIHELDLLATLSDRSHEDVKNLLTLLDQRIQTAREEASAAGSAMKSSFEQLLANIKERIRARAQYLESANPERNLHLGYSIVTDSHGKVLKDAKRLRAGEDIETKLARGSFTSRVRSIRP